MRHVLVLFSFIFNPFLVRFALFFAVFFTLFPNVWNFFVLVETWGSSQLRVRCAPHIIFIFVAPTTSAELRRKSESIRIFYCRSSDPTSKTLENQLLRAKDAGKASKHSSQDIVEEESSQIPLNWKQFQLCVRTTKLPGEKLHLSDLDVDPGHPGKQLLALHRVHLVKGKAEEIGQMKAILRALYDYVQNLVYYLQIFYVLHLRLKVKTFNKAFWCVRMTPPHPLCGAICAHLLA